MGQRVARREMRLLLEIKRGGEIIGEIRLQRGEPVAVERDEMRGAPGKLRQLGAVARRRHDEAAAAFGDRNDVRSRNPALRRPKLATIGSVNSASHHGAIMPPA